MIVVSDTSPISYLALIGREGLLPTLFGEIAIPASVILVRTGSHAELFR